MDVSASQAQVGRCPGKEGRNPCMETAGLRGMRLFIIFLALPSLLQAQRDCSSGACYPPVGDLLIGRSSHLKASSTCGLTKPETFCAPYGEWQMKCCRCDSREPLTQTSHRIMNVLSPLGPLRWWQSQNDVDQVSLHFDLDRKFQLSDLMLDFRSPVPAGMVIERSSDFGKTWKVYQFLAHNCAASFPHVRRGHPERLEDVRCQELTSDPTQGGKIRFSPVELASGVISSHSQRTNQLGEFTNLRVNFTQLTRLPARKYHTPSAFYAVSELHVRGSCLCYGHAERCVPGSGPSGDPHANVQIHEVCACQHNTEGLNCERCADSYNDLPWRPADDQNPNACKRCNCNNHSDKCHFDPAVYQASGGVSGGVCDDCRDGTTGNNCERCKTNFFRHPQRDISHRDACISCDCDPEGSVDKGSCDPMTGRCTCKQNVAGERCHQCKAGFYQLSGSNPLGCRNCDCNPLGTRSDQPCDGDSGQCFCLPNVTGAKCDQCSSNHWNLASGRGCQKCECDPRYSYSPQCNQVTGQCLCREGFGGRLCTECADRSYGSIQTGCRACSCNFQGTQGAGCDKATGRCLCLPGFSGSRCDECQRGYCDDYPSCVACHPCFQSHDAELSRFSSQQRALRNASSGLVWPLDTSYGPRVKEAEARLQQMQAIVSSPLVTDGELEKAKNSLTAMRATAQQISPDLPFVEETQTLTTDLESLNMQLTSITIQYQDKKGQYENSTIVDPSGAFRTVSSAYQTSMDASSRAAGTSSLLAQSQESRRDIREIENEIKGDRGKLEALQGEMSYPSLNPTINRVCGGVRSEPCTPQHCSGILCPLDNATECGMGSACKGTFPLARNALRTAERSAGQLKNLNGQFQQTAQMIRAAEQTAKQIKDKAQLLVGQVSSARTQMEEDMRRTRQFIQKVRDFLADPGTDPATIQQVSEHVLSLQLPADSAAILRKMNEIRSIAAKLPNVDAVLSQTKRDIARAKQLQKEAEEARNKANLVEGNVEDVVTNVRRARTALQEAEDTIGGSSYSMRLIEDRLGEIQQVLTPSEKSLKETSDQLQRFNQKVSQLGQKSEQNRLQAGQAGEAAGDASANAAAAQQGMEAVKQKYALLKSRLGQTSNLGAQGEKVQTLQREAESLFQESLGMMSRMETIEMELQEGSQALIVKAASLAGLEERIAGIRNDINARAAFFALCK
ncbi:laminin subunit beta-3 isoform X2 [Rhinatrema bivittatum]|uniref:laminin subunit beta-3 isoform X2 n=1 Tax=Rhinatrema bivittatum TaxID=194408 RepID=UPI001129B07E|nr:laminin subunit beta-3 isoform X2 [Rhinatrema bivittatum]XP_029429943.1 laminin subunit beta-3 isoform X2 [Rhinatrema bivittatum]